MTGDSIINPRVRSVLPIALFSAYMLSFVFEGPAFYSMAKYYDVNPIGFVMIAVTALFLGLLAGGLLTKNSMMAKRVMLIGMTVCFGFTCVFFFPSTELWRLTMAVSAFASGGAIAAWGYFLKAYTPSGQRIKSCADVLICSNILMILVNFVTIHFSHFAGLGLALLLIAAAIVSTAALPPVNEPDDTKSTSEKTAVSVTAPLAALVIFVVVITINSGLMYQAIVPAFAHLTSLTSWYWAVPYISALFIMRNYYTGKPRSLYLGMGMIIAAYVFFVALDRGTASYIVVDTLILGACGIFDLFWWSILGEMLDLSDRPARVFGVGLAANVFGILIGNLLALFIDVLALPASGTTIAALVVVCVTLMLLPPLNLRLSALLKSHAYLTAFSAMPPAKQKELMHDVPLPFYEPLTTREQEVLVLVLNGKKIKAIAGELSVSESTVKTHLQNLFGKYNVNSRLELISKLLKEPAS